VDTATGTEGAAAEATGVTTAALRDVPETLLIPLYGRAAETPRPDAIVRDSKAVELVGRLDADFSRFGRGYAAARGRAGAGATARSAGRGDRPAAPARTVRAVRGSRASRTASPTRCTARVVRKMARPG
jgi:hypothetical protein